MMSAQIGNVNGDRFDIFLSLALLMLTVVGGIGYMSGALFAGVLSACAFVAMTNTLQKLGHDYASIEALFAFLVSLVTVLPATIGITMGKNPSGAVTDIVDALNLLKHSKPLMGTIVGLEALIWGLTASGVITNWHFVILTAVNLLVVPAVGGKIVMAVMMKRAGVPPPTPPELIGIDRPYTTEDLATMDHALGLDAVIVPTPGDAGKETVGAAS
jgi:branched-chain amino acid transport system permease protein